MLWFYDSQYTLGCTWCPSVWKRHRQVEKKLFLWNLFFFTSACLKAHIVFCFFCAVQSVCGVKFDSGIATHAHHLPAVSGPGFLCPIAASHGHFCWCSFRQMPLQQDRVLQGCFCSLVVTSALLLMLLRCYCVSYAVSWAPQLSEMPSSWKRGQKRPWDIIFATRGQTCPSLWGLVAALCSLLAFAL